MTTDDDRRAMVALVRDQAREVGRGWSGVDADPGWALTAALFRAVADEDALAALAAEIPADRLPALLFVACIQRVVAEHPADELARYYPGPGQRPVDDEFGATVQRFVVDRADELRRYFGRRYQMNEVGRCVQTALALGVTQRMAPQRPIALVDIGTGSGLGLLLDRYGVDLGAAGRFGPEDSPVRLTCEVVGSPPLPPAAPDIVVRIGVDAAPIDLDDTDSVTWLAACTPPSIDAQQRFAGAVAITRAARPRIIQGDGATLVAEIIAGLPDGPLVVVVDSYTSVFFDDRARAVMGAAVDGCGRDAVWIALDPLVPLGTTADRSVQGLPVDPRLVEQNRAGGVFALLAMTGSLGGRRVDRVLATAHPSGTRMTWLDGSERPA